jgi:hypothetical protein
MTKNERGTSRIIGTQAMRIDVEHYVGHGGVPMPGVLHFGVRSIRVIETLDQWYGSDHRYVKVRGHDGALYIVKFDEVRADWELTLFERRTCNDAPRRFS